MIWTRKTDPGIDALEHIMEIQPNHPGVGINLTALYVDKGWVMKAKSDGDSRRAGH